MRWAALGAVGVVLLPVLAIGAAVGGLGDARAGGAWGGRPEALGDIPPGFLALYGEAAARFGVPVQVLAAVGKVECDHGRNPACARANSAGAVGPMQFLPATFAAYAGASGNPNPSILDPRDAVFAAAAKLAADGVVADPVGAIYSYNHAHWYVATVVAWAVAYGWSPAPAPAVLAHAVVHHPNLALRPQAAADVEAGVVDARVLAVLLVLATHHQLGSIGPFVTGHGYYVSGTARPSNHVFGRAVDVFVVDGAAVSPGNDAARSVAEEVLALPEGLRPTEVGLPWAQYEGLPGAFADADHLDHLHFGYHA